MERKEPVKATQEELNRQIDYINKIKAINQDCYEKTGQKKLITIQTFGCQMNAHDSEKLIGMAEEMGYSETKDEKEADIIIYNTCCVRENAENKVYGNLGFLKSLKRNKKDLKIVLCGCMMQQDTVIEKIKQAYRHVDIIFGTFNLYRFPELLYTNMETNHMIIDVWEEHQEIVEDLPTKRAYPFKSSVNIMFGCNNFCSYCIVPYVRGRERSREIQDIINEVRDLANDGVKEITLLGQNVNSYSHGFANLLKRVQEIDGIERIRFMTSHPKDLSEELIYAIRDLDKVCNHIHLPFQSGSTSILKKMNRKYTKDEYLDLIYKIKKEIKDVAITTDIIVGFPSETEEDFEETLDVVKKVGFANAFTFLYSKRTGTPAAIHEEQIEESVTKERFDRLLNILNPIIYDINKEYIGKTLKVLVEDVNSHDNMLVTGRTETNALVHLQPIGIKESYDETIQKVLGSIVNVKITDCKTFYLIGQEV